MRNAESSNGVSLCIEKKLCVCVRRRLQICALTAQQLSAGEPSEVEVEEEEQREEGEGGGAHEVKLLRGCVSAFNALSF